jgi:hypothetical protein
MTVEIDQGVAWIAGALAAFPILNQALAFWHGVKGRERQPPLAEEVAGKYALRSDLAACREQCDRDIGRIRQAVADNDRKAEERAHDTHRRIDAVYERLNETNRRLGVIIGALHAQGRLPASALDGETKTGG